MPEIERIIFDENRFDQKVLISNEDTIFRFHNDSNGVVKKEQLFKKIETLKNKEFVKVLSIGWSSSLENLEILPFFPNTVGLSLYGKNLKNLKGIENSKINNISILTDSNNGRTLDGLEKICLTNLEIRIVCKNDLEILKNCESLKVLRIEGSFDIDFQIFSGLKYLEDIILINRKIEEIKNLNCLKSIKEFDVSYCTKLKLFGNNNNAISNLHVQACNKLNLNSLCQFNNLQFLTLISLSNISDFNFITNLEKLRNISITASKLAKTNIDAIKNSNTLLEVFMNSKNKIIEEIGTFNKKILISNGDICFYKGEMIKFEEYQKHSEQIYKNIIGSS